MVTNTALGYLLAHSFSHRLANGSGYVGRGTYHSCGEQEAVAPRTSALSAAGTGKACSEQDGAGGSLLGQAAKYHPGELDFLPDAARIPRGFKSRHFTDIFHR